ncbi:hypothetical protein AAFF_G00183410 [Aldrovandia affinis]|uniref:ATP-sulfurylase PUA-like domain-containing protein n=1 Tax=Aldrovandia affinis TaxID=143900 RepID=A0AAD7R0E3_9TELE|nr:hypothetical protein AAFF_G00183410 [Aldrovandia affinis]
MEEVNELFVSENKLNRAIADAKTLPTLSITKLDLQWVQVLAEGWATPSKGFMRERSTCKSSTLGTLLDGGTINLSVPIVLPVSTEKKRAWIAALPLPWSSRVAGWRFSATLSSTSTARRSAVPGNGGHPVRSTLTSRRHLRCPATQPRPQRPRPADAGHQRRLLERGYPAAPSRCPPWGLDQDDDVPLDWRMKQHAVLEEGVLDPDATIVPFSPAP